MSALRHVSDAETTSRDVVQCLQDLIDQARDGQTITLPQLAHLMRAAVATDANLIRARFDLELFPQCDQPSGNAVSLRVLDTSPRHHGSKQ